MTNTKVLAQRYPRLAQSTRGVVAGWNRVGEQIGFYLQTIGDIRIAVRRYSKEIVRLVSQMSLGQGALALIGGTVVIVGFLTLSTGAIIAVQGYNQLSGIGVEAPPHSWAPCGSLRRSTHSR
jgi:phospholipid/cholesterol/gamma-HCH transport system permease protein